MAEPTWPWMDTGSGAIASGDVSEHPRPADVRQLEFASLLHREECQRCTPEQPCEMSARLEDARRKAEAS
jgi:hypothetical protein